MASKKLMACRIKCFWLCVLPESNRRNPSHERIGSDALQVEQATIEKQQQDDVLTKDQALSTLPNRGDILEIKQNHQESYPLVFLSIVAPNKSGN